MFIIDILQAQNDWENPADFEHNQSVSHFQLTPFLNVEEALRGDCEACAFYQTLKGKWKFNWVGPAIFDWTVS